MNPAAYYNENDPYAADWLENLIAAGHIAPGVVDRRSIVDISPAELAGFTQCHFFAGIGVWSAAARAAGWPDDRPLWTMSCPCQPFSAAGSGAGFADERHLWPHAFHLIGVRRPVIVVGEQVASRDGLGWLDLVSSDLEATAYTVGAVDACAAGFGAPHIRQRQYWAATRLEHATGDGRVTRRAEPGGRSAAGGCSDQRLAEPVDSGCPQGRQHDAARQPVDAWGGKNQRLADGNNDGCETRGEVRPVRAEHDVEHGGTARLERPGPTNGVWADADWLHCRDGKWRPVEPGTFPLAHGAPARVGRLRAYGNAIVLPEAKAFIQCVM